MNRPQIAVILVNWNGCEDTLACLSSIKNLHKREYELETIIVDNASTDGSVGKIQKQHPWVTVLKSSTNVGFSGGNNIGIRYALKKNIEYLWLLNNDTILDGQALSIFDAFHNPDVGAAGPKIYFEKGYEYHKKRYKKTELGNILWYAGGIIDWKNMQGVHRGVDEVDHGQYDHEEETDFITGCSFAIRKSVIEKIGFLDERYFLYYEDLDYSMKIKNAGYRLMYVPTSVVYHKNAGTTGGSGSKMHVYYMTRNRLLVGMKYAPWRTKLALIRESIGKYIHGSHQEKEAIKDFVTGKFGNTYET